MFLLTGWFSANAALLFWQRKRTWVSFSFFLHHFTSGGGTLSLAIFWQWLPRSRALQVEATRWVLVLEEKPTGYTSLPPLRWLQPRSPTCNSFKPTTSCSCRPSKVSRCCHQVACSYIYQCWSLIKSQRRLYSGRVRGEGLQSWKNKSFYSCIADPLHTCYHRRVLLNTVHFNFSHGHCPFTVNELHSVIKLVTRCRWSAYLHV